MNINYCDLCPRSCGADREKNELGFCRAGSKIEISWSGLHFGEEPPISGKDGSGTIFFCHCNLKCVFCQNWQISQECTDCQRYSPEKVVEIMLDLEKRGAHNINLVTPTIWSFWLKNIILEAKSRGLKIPVLWNSNAYEKIETLKEFNGLVDIYLPDYKYYSEELAVNYSSAPKYPLIARKAILEMYRQVGDLKLDKNGIAKKGLIVRHLILPNAFGDTKNSLEFIRSISKNIHLSLMSQYNPLYRASEFKKINRSLTAKEFREIKKLVDDLNFKYGWIQEYRGPVKCLNPNFLGKSPFG